MLEAFNEEKLAARDECVENIYNLAKFATDSGTRFNANKFILEKTHPDFTPQTKVVHEGGQSPIQLQAMVVQVPAEVLQMSVEQRMAMLEHAEQEQQKAIENE